MHNPDLAKESISALDKDALEHTHMNIHTPPLAAITQHDTGTQSLWLVVHKLVGVAGPLLITQAKHDHCR